VCRSKITTSDFPDSSGKHSLASCGRENWNDAGKGNYVSRLSDDCVCVVSGEMAGGEWRWMNSRASAREASAAAPAGACCRIDFPKLGASLKRTLRGITV